MGRKILSLKKPWVGHHYHSTYSIFARGLSILVRKSLPFWLLGLVLDLDGRYIIMHAMVESLEVVLAGIYIPPPASIRLQP